VDSRDHPAGKDDQFGVVEPFQAGAWAAGIGGEVFGGIGFDPEQS
jgi:hypothetical protein